MKKLLITILGVCLFAGLSAQLTSFDIKELSESNYYNEALEAIYKKRKKLTSADYADIAVLAYKIHDYTRSIELFGQVQPDHTLTEDQKIIYFEVLRINSQYKKSSQHIPSSYSFDNNIVNNFIDYPTNNLKLNKFVTINKSNIDFGRTFMGMAFGQNEMILTKNIKKKSKVRDLFIGNFDGTDNLTESDKIITKKSKFIYRANPTIFNTNEYIYTKSIVDYSSYEAKKEDEFVHNNLLKLFKYNKETQVETELTLFNSDQTNTVTPYYWAEENILFYAVTSIAGRENYDIYYSKHDNGKWGTPVKLNGINTNFNEVYPFVQNGKLYFSSRGHQNFGGLDLFSIPIKVEGDKVVLGATPKNMGKPFNSSFDDFAISYMTDSTGYFASNRNGTEGSDELYKFIDNSPQDILIVLKDNEGLVINNAEVNVFQTDENGNKTLVNTFSPDINGEIRIPIEAGTNYELAVKSPDFLSRTAEIDPNEIIDVAKEVVLDDQITASVILNDITSNPVGDMEVRIYELKNGTYQLVETVTSDENGKWEYPFSRNKDYKVELKNEDEFETKSYLIPSIKDKNRKSKLSELAIIRLTPILKPGDVIQLQNITFDFDSDKLTDESIEILNKVYDYLIENPEINIELSAHTDCEGSKRYNRRLSKKRAKSCFKYLVNKGIDEDRMEKRGYGEEYILNECIKPRQCSKEQNRENRRVEIKIK